MSCGAKQHCRLLRNRSTDLPIRGQYPFDEGGAEALVFHFVQSGDGAALGGGDLVDLRLGMGTAFEQDGCRASHGLVGDEGRRVRVETDLDPALLHGPHEAQGIGDPASPQDSRGIHQVFRDAHAATHPAAGYVGQDAMAGISLLNGIPSHFEIKSLKN